MSKILSFLLFGAKYCLIFLFTQFFYKNKNNVLKRLKNLIVYSIVAGYLPGCACIVLPNILK